MNSETERTSSKTHQNIPPKAKKRKETPHDRLLKSMLSKLDTARAILKWILPQHIIQELDWNTLTLEATELPRPHRTPLRTDLVFEIQRQDNHQAGYIVILLEHQRREDYWLPLRLLLYITLLWHSCARRKKVRTLPFIYPIVLYNGKRPYRSPRSLSAYFPGQDVATYLTDLVLKPCQFLDLATTSDTQIEMALSGKRPGEWAGKALLLTMRHIDDMNLLTFLDEKLGTILQQLNETTHLEDLDELLQYIVDAGKIDDESELATILHRHLHEEDATMSLARKWEARGEARGEVRGKEQGMVMVARNSLKDGVSLETIAKWTGLSEAQLQELLLTPTI